MKKKLCLILGSLFALIICVALFLGKQLKRTVAVSTISEGRIEELLEELSFSEELEFQLLFHGETVPYDAARGIYYLPQTIKEDWLWEDAFSLSDDTLRLWWCEDDYWGNLEKAIAEGHEFFFLVSNDVEVRKEKIVFTGLPMMKVERIQALEEERFYCKVTILDPFHNKNGRYEIKKCYGYLEVRGKTSRLFPKKGWNLSLVKENGNAYKTSLFGLREDDDWKLNALYSDATKVRECVAIELWNELAQQTDGPYDTGTKMEYFELFLENDYHGIYGAMEQLDFKLFSLDKSEDVIYKGFAWPREGNTDETSLDGVGDYCGHLIKTFDRPITAELWKPMVEYVKAANFTAEKGESFHTDVFYKYIQSNMDMDNFLNCELFVQTLYAFDNKYKNMYIVADRKDDGDYTLWKVPWDLNYSFGDRYHIESNALTLYNLDWAKELMPEFMMSETLLASGNEEFIKLLNEKWEELKKSTLSVENIQNIAEENIDKLTLSGAFERDAKRWKDGPHSTSLEEMLEFHSCRLDFLDEHYQSFLNEN